MRKLPPLACLRAFEAAARHLSFKDAAAELGVTPTAISHQIRLLEDTCGVPLFQRRPRPLALTGAGARLYPTLRDGFDAFGAAIASIAHAELRHSLKVTSPNAFASRWLVPRLPQWLAANPTVPLEIIGTDVILDLHAGDADVAIRYARSMPLEMAAIELFRDNFFPVCRPELLAHIPIKRAADLLQYPLIHFDWYRGDSDVPNWQHWLATARSVDPALAEPDLNWQLSFREELHAIDAVVAGQGIAICSDVVVSRELQAGTLIRAHNLSLPGYGYYLVHLHNHPHRASIEAFSAWMRFIRDDEGIDSRSHL